MRSPSRALLLVLAACSAAPPLRPVVADALLPELAASPGGDELLATLQRLHAAGHHADVRALAGCYAAELAQALVTSSPETLPLATALDGDAAALAAMPTCDRGPRERLGRMLQDCREALRRGELAEAEAFARAAEAVAGHGRARAATSLWRSACAAVAGDDAAPQQFAAAVTATAPFGPGAVVRAELVAAAATGDPAAWRRAVTLATATVRRHPSSADPWAWRRALELQPAGESWPHDADAALLASLPELRVAGATEPLVATWFAVGEQHRRRDEPLAALTAFRQAESLAKAPTWRALAQVGQARALLAGGRSGDARGALEPSLLGDDGAGKACALAMLAAIELAEERPAVAQQLLDKAFTMVGEGAFPLRGSALANLGIARLQLGQAVAGQQALVQARAAFVQQRDVAGCALVLANEELCARELQLGDLREVLRLQDDLRVHGMP